MGKNDKILVRWVTKDSRNGVKQKVRRIDIKPADEVLRSGQEVQLKWSGRLFRVVVCEDWLPKTRKGNFLRDDRTCCRIGCLLLSLSKFSGLY